MLSKNELNAAVGEALKRLLQIDGSLFDCPIEEDFPYDARKLHEVCINHKLANHLEAVILPLTTHMGKMFVDIEFNREGLNPKEAPIGDENKKVRPDIIVHNRRSAQNKKNLLVIECKKTGCSPEDIDKDQSKIWALMEDPRYSYSFGLWVAYGKDRIDADLFYKNGTGISSEHLPITIDAGH
jgi:hypothetical protein